jgi:IMP dehydrogenase
MAREGGIGIIHKNLTAEEQATQVLKVKRAESGMIVDPITVRPDQPLAQALEIMRQHEISRPPGGAGRQARGHPHQP